MEREEFVQRLFLILVEKNLTPAEMESGMPSYLDAYDKVVREDSRHDETLEEDAESSERDKEDLKILCYNNPVKRYVEYCYQLFRPGKNKEIMMDELCNADFLEEKAHPYFSDSDGKMKAKGQWRWNRLRLLEYFQGQYLVSNRGLLEMAIDKVKKENLK